MFGVSSKELCKSAVLGESAREEDKYSFLKVQFRIYEFVRCILQN
jgi:hypothetical protein